MRPTSNQTMSKRKRKNQKRKAKAAALAQGALGSIIHPDAAGIDVGAEELPAPAGAALRAKAPPFGYLAPLDSPLLANVYLCLLYTSPSPRDRTRSRMPSSA